MSRSSRKKIFYIKRQKLFDTSRFVGDCQMPKALAMFIDIRGQDIVQKNLFRNFSLHLVNLFEFGVIGPSHVFTAISRLQVNIISLLEYFINENYFSGFSKKSWTTT